MFAVQVSHKMIVPNLFQLERDADLPPVAFGDLVDVADSDVILLEPKLYGIADYVQLLRQSLIGNGCRLQGLTYKIQPLSCESILGLLAWTGAKFRPSWQA